MSTPFKTMKAVYVYLAAFVGLLIVAMGLYSFLEYLLNVLFMKTSLNAIFIIKPFSQIIVGLFIMVPHWAIGHHFHLIEHKNNSRKK
jgi:hypothetical protein